MFMPAKFESHEKLDDWQKYPECILESGLGNISKTKK